MPRQCLTYGNPLPEAAGFCPACGTAAGPPVSEGPASAGPSAMPSTPPIVVPPPTPPSPPTPPPAPPPAGYRPPGGGGQDQPGWTPPPPALAKPIEQIVAEGYHIDLGVVISEGWNLFMANVGGFVGFGVVGGLIALLLAVTVIGLLFVTPLMAGFFIVPLLMLKGRRTSFGTFFDGFDRLGAYMLLGLVMGIFVFFGYVFLIIPGIYLTVAYTWALALMADRRMGYWDAMKASMRVVNRNFWETLLLVLIVSVISSLGGIVAFGYILTMPLSYCILMAAYRRIFGLSAV
jgi:hypothetical protein